MPEKIIPVFRIEKNVPMPVYSPRGAKLYPLEKMEIGDSFLIPKSEDETEPPLTVLRSRVNGIIGGVQRRTNLRFATVTMPDGIRVWRVADRKKDEKSANPTRRHISPEGMDRIVEAQHKRWKKFRTEKKRQR